MHDITELHKLIDTRDLITKRIKTDRELLAQTILRISEICTCPTTIKKRQYVEGGYDYTSESRTWDECTLCGRVHNLEIRHGGFA